MTSVSNRRCAGAIAVMAVARSLTLLSAISLASRKSTPSGTNTTASELRENATLSCHSVVLTKLSNSGKSAPRSDMLSTGSCNRLWCTESSLWTTQSWTRYSTRRSSFTKMRRQTLFLYTLRICEQTSAIAHIDLYVSPLAHVLRCHIDTMNGCMSRRSPGALLVQLSSTLELRRTCLTMQRNSSIAGNGTLIEVSTSSGSTSVRMTWLTRTRDPLPPRLPSGMLIVIFPRHDYRSLALTCSTAHPAQARHPSFAPSPGN